MSTSKVIDSLVAMHTVAGGGFISKQYSIGIAINFATIVHLFAFVCNKYIISYGLLVKSLWNLHFLAEKLLSGAKCNQNSSGLHRMPKVVVLVFKELLVNFVNSDLIIKRFAPEYLIN